MEVPVYRFCSGFPNWRFFPAASAWKNALFLKGNHREARKIPLCCYHLPTVATSKKHRVRTAQFPAHPHAAMK